MHRLTLALIAAGVVASVSAAAGEVAQNSNEIAGNNVDLSDRTARSAASLQNTASSVEQIASNLNGASELTRKASTIASKARQSASAGGNVVSQVVSTIEEINTTAQRKFLETFALIRTNFIETFKSLFDPGDECDLKLEPDVVQAGSWAEWLSMATSQNSNKTKPAVRAISCTKRCKPLGGGGASLVLFSVCRE